MKVAVEVEVVVKVAVVVEVVVKVTVVVEVLVKVAVGNRLLFLFHIRVFMSCCVVFTYHWSVLTH